jgi:CubicO group peptidase (beta-lactamase class C family)
MGNVRLTKNFLAASIFAVLFLNNASLAQTDYSRLDAYITRSMEDWAVPGLAVGIVKDGEVAYARGYGLRDLTTGEPVGEFTVFAIGSCTKAFTSIALAMLVSEGQLNWDDNVVKYLPAFQLYDPYVTRELTIRDALSHRTGLPHADHLWFGSTLDRATIVNRLRLIEPKSSFRYEFEYSNNMYIVAGEIIMAATGTSWDDFIRERIFEPLGMKSSRTSIPSSAKNEDAAVPYLFKDGRRLAVPWRDMNNAAPAGGIVSNVHDMMRWLMLQLNYGDFGGHRYIDSVQVVELQVPQTVIHPDSPVRFTFPIGSRFLSYGMGWFVSSYQGRKVVDHAGGVDGMMAHVLMVPEERLGVVVLSNMITQFLPLAISQWIMDRELDLPEKDWSTERLNVYRAHQERLRSAEEEKVASRVVGTTPSLTLDRYAGSYSHPIYGQAEVREMGGKLRFEFTPSFTSTLEHWHYDTFKAVWKDRMMAEDFVTFLLGADGRVEKLSIERFGDFDRISK